MYPQKMHDSTYSVSLHSNEFSQALGYYPFTINLDRSVERCKTLNVLSNKVCNNW